MADNGNRNVEQEASRIGIKGAKRVFKMFGKKLVVLSIIFVLVIGLLAALFNYMRDKDCINSNDPDNKFYRPYGPIARNNSVYISEDGTLMPEMSIDEMWENDKRYARYLTKGGKDELAYLVNAQLVTQYPYIASAPKDKLNGTVKFYRNDSYEPMVYVKPEVLEKYVKDYNKGKTDDLGKALNSFTINPDASITVAYLSEASYSVTTDDENAAKDAKSKIGGSISGGDGSYGVYKEESTLYTTNISYINYIQNYVLPFNFLWAIIVWGNSSHRGAGSAQDLAHAIATMAYHGEISLVIDDNNYTTNDTDTYNYELTDHYRGTLQAYIKTTTTSVVNDGTTSVQNRTDTKHSSTTEQETMDNVTKKIRDYTTVYEEYHSDNNPDLKIRKIESWCAVFNNDAVFDSEVTSNEDKPDKSTLSDSEEKLIKTHTGKSGIDNMINEGIEKVKKWKKTIERKHSNPTTTSTQDHGGGVTSTTTTSTRIDYAGTNVNVTENYTNIKLSSVNVSISTSFANGTVTSPSFNLDIADLFNVSIFYDAKKATVNLDENTRVLKAMANNEDTANMIDLFKYIYNKILNPDYDKTEEEFKSLWDDIFSSMTTIEFGDYGDWVYGKGSEKDFIRTIAPYAVINMEKHQVYASVCIAQACLESGYGGASGPGSIICKSCKNYFGMKLLGMKRTEYWDGAKEIHGNSEGDGGTCYWRIYDSLMNSVYDYGLHFHRKDLLYEKKGMFRAFERNEGPEKQLLIEKEVGYFTSDTYVEKAMDIIRRFNLTQYDKMSSADFASQLKSGSESIKEENGDGYTQTVTFNGKEYKEFRQSRGKYSGETYSEGTIASSGCGPTSAAIVASGYGSKYDPGSLVKAAKSKYKVSNFKASPDATGKMLTTAGINFKLIASSKFTKSIFENHLKSGKPIVLDVNNSCGSLLTSGQHYVAVLGIKDNKVYVSNPNPKKATGWLDMDKVFKCCINALLITD